MKKIILLFFMIVTFGYSQNQDNDYNDLLKKNPFNVMYPKFIAEESANYFDTFKKCRYVFCTFAPLGKGGYHHVNTQDQNYWIETFKKFDFKFEEEKTKSIRQSSTINKNFVREYGLLFKNNNKNI